MPTTTSNRYFSPVVNSNHAASPGFQYVWDNGAVTSGGAGLAITGAWRPVTPGDLSSTLTLTGSGLMVVVDDVAVTGGSIAISNNPGVTIITPVVAVSGYSTLTNPVTLTGNPQVQLSSAVALTGAPLVTLGSQPIYVTGAITITGGAVIATYTGVQPVSVTNFSASIAITGSPVVTLTGVPSVTISNALAISGVSSPVYITGAGFSPTFQTLTGSQLVVPVGARSYAFTVISGNGYVNGAAVFQGLSIAGGGYGFATLTSTIAIGTTGGCIFASYE